MTDSTSPQSSDELVEAKRIEDLEAKEEDYMLAQEQNGQDIKIAD